MWHTLRQIYVGPSQFLCRARNISRSRPVLAPIPWVPRNVPDPCWMITLPSCGEYLAGGKPLQRVKMCPVGWVSGMVHLPLHQIQATEVLPRILCPMKGWFDFSLCNKNTQFWKLQSILQKFCKIFPEQLSWKMFLKSLRAWISPDPCSKIKHCGFSTQNHLCCFNPYFALLWVWSTISTCSEL